MWFVICHCCEHQGMAQPSEQEAIAAWNRRANSDLRPEVTELGNAK